MRARASKEHSETLARRLELLSAELNGEGSARAPVELRSLDPVEVAPPLDPGSAAPVLPYPGRHAARRRPPQRRWIDLTPLTGRVGLEPAHVAIAAVVAVMALAVTCWWVLRDDAGEPLAARPAAAPLVTAPSAPSAGVPASVTELVVDVTGKVRRPGIVVLEPGARVVDAIEAAGGARRGTDLTGLNLARLLVDGEQVVVGVEPPPGIASSSAAAPGRAAGALVNLNLAGVAELDVLPGVGPVTAQAIVDWRDANGGFRSVDQLLDVKGIGEVTLAELAPLVTL